MNKTKTALKIALFVIDYSALNASKTSTWTTKQTALMNVQKSTLKMVLTVPSVVNTVWSVNHKLNAKIVWTIITIIKENAWTLVQMPHMTRISSAMIVQKNVYNVSAKMNVRPAILVSTCTPYPLTKLFVLINVLPSTSLSMAHAKCVEQIARSVMMKKPALSVWITVMKL